MATTLEAVADGTGRPLQEASDDEVIGMMGCWQRVEAHAHARMLAAVREIIRRRVPAGENPAAYPGELPSGWELGVAHEVSAELRISTRAAAPLVHLAWELQARLPGTGRLLDEGILTALKSKIVVDEFGVLDDEKIIEAEKRLLDEDLTADDLTPGRLRKLCQLIADTTDPEGARRRREQAQRDRARVTFYRAHGGDTAMFAEGLPPDEALKAQANIQARALDCKWAKIYPEAGIDLLRVLAMLDLINGITLDARISKYHTEHAAAEDARNAAQRAADQQAADDLAKYRPGDGSGDGRDSAGASGPGYEWPDDEDGSPEPPLPDEAPPDPDDCEFWPGYPPPGGYGEARGGNDSGQGGSDPNSDGPDSDGDGPGGNGDDSGGDGGGGGGSRPAGPGPGGIPGGGTPDPGLPALTHLTLPLETLLHLDEKPGEAPGYGSVDPSLARDLGMAAAGSPRTQYCLTITDEHGHAIGHACARLLRATRPPASGWSLTPDPARPGPDSGYGSWILTVPGGRRYRLGIDPVPTHSCDHRLATPAYRPGAKLRHLVEIRDGECTFTTCSHPARLSDFEHGVPYDQGGVTDACNGGARSRRCHRVKQSRGWSVTQPEPGRHVWRTPSGRTYTKEPKRYG